jgi:hypothetical protein
VAAARGIRGDAAGIAGIGTATKPRDYAGNRPGMPA